MRIGEVAAGAGVSVQAVRLYERRGLLKPAKRLASGYRDYSTDAVAFVRFIKQAQRHGFTLEEIRSLIGLRKQSPANVTRVREMARAKVAAIDEKINRLKSQRDAIEHGLNRCRCSEMFPLCIFTRLIDERPSNK
jgi:MerR family transcriptional regulator, mercuric resistance operon regulatory protein